MQPHAFGPFVFDPAAGELRRDGVLLPGLGRRGAALLAALLGARGEPVGKDELMARAWPGQIVEDANLSVQIAALRKALGTADSGAQWIVTVPGVGYRFVRTGPDAVATPGPAKPSIAVMPFESRSGDPEQGYFADGIVEDLITALSRFKGFAVAARNSSQAVGRTDPAEIGRILGVRYLLEGSVRRRGDELRVTVRLLDPVQGATLWSEQFDGALAELFDVQDRIVDEVVGRIEPEVRRAEIDRARRKRPDSLDAYDLYLRALPHFRGTDPATRSEAVRLLEGAIALDPEFATALAYGAWAHERHDTFGSGAPEADRAMARARALELAERAVAVGHDDPQVMAIAALVLINIGHQSQRGLAMLDEAQRANPNNPTVLSLYAFTNVMRGDLMAGRAAFLRALAISPAALDNYELLVGVALSHLLSGEFEDSIDWSLRSLAANPDWLGTYWTLGAAYGQLGRLDEGREIVRRLLARAPAMRLSHLEHIGERHYSRFDVVIDGLRKAGLPD
jgi:TolB-like protein/Flp pilus assembly protein TadD